MRRTHRKICERRRSALLPPFSNGTPKFHGAEGAALPPKYCKRGKRWKALMNGAIIVRRAIVKARLVRHRNQHFGTKRFQKVSSDAFATLGHADTGPAGEADTDALGPTERRR